jgi:toxin ParE1/3/4
MTYLVKVLPRAAKDLETIYRRIGAASSAQARAWFNGMEAEISSLDRHPARGAPTPENRALRHLLYGKKLHAYRIIYAIDEGKHIVNILHIRHGARDKVPLTDIA